MNEHMFKKVKLRWRHALLAAGFVVLAVGVFLVVPLPGCGIRSDAALARRFRWSRADFEQMRDMMLAEPKLYYVSKEMILWNPPTGGGDGSGLSRSLSLAGVSQERYAEYLRLLRKTGADSVSRAGGPRPKGVIAIEMCSWGLAVSGQGKSLVFYPQDMSYLLQHSDPDGPRIVDDGTETHYRERHKGVWLRPLGDSWYIEYSTW
jgi:hypothetical protein